LAQSKFTKTFSNTLITMGELGYENTPTHPHTHTHTHATHEPYGVSIKTVQMSLLGRLKTFEATSLKSAI
jgi:hypothetical protein